MTTDLYGRDHRKTFVILLLSANLLLLLALFAQVSEQRRASERAAKTMKLALREKATRGALERQGRELEIVLRERLQARLKADEAQARVEQLTTAVAHQGDLVTSLTSELARVRAERDEHQSVRIALERRLSDALDLLATHDELKARAGELDQALLALAAARADQDLATTEIERLRRQVIVLERLVAALKTRLKVVRGS